MIAMWDKKMVEKKKDRLCIPEHQKARIEKIAEKQKNNTEEGEDLSGARAMFEVTDCFQLHDLSVIKGTVTKGIITKKDKLIVKEKTQRIYELWVNEKKVDALHEGDSGAIFVKAKNIRLAPGDIIEIE
ncbi:MAG: hypothetical protein QXM75_02615 [Candidatus Diapherotrites archaeon]